MDGIAPLKKYLIVLSGILTLTAVANASTASQREYRRGFSDCSAGRWDENQHGASYKEGCAAAEAKRKTGDDAPAGGSPASGTPSTGATSTRNERVDAYMDPSVPGKDKRACLRAVGKMTHNTTLSVIGAQSSEANNQVTIGVGTQRAPWKCLVKRGEVAEVMSLTDEGAL